MKLRCDEVQKYAPKDGLFCSLVNTYILYTYLLAMRQQLFYEAMQIVLMINKLELSGFKLTVATRIMSEVFRF